jgi:integrase
MKPNFYLKSASAEASEKQLIYLFFSFENTRLKFSTGQHIAPKYWNKTSQRPRKNYEGFDVLNPFLDELEQQVMNIYTRSLTEGINVTVEYLRAKLNSFLNKDEEKKLTLIDYLDKYIAYKKGLVRDTTIEKFEHLKKKLLKFSKDCKFPITFETMNLEFYNEFKKWMFSQGKERSTTNKNISLFKIFLHWCELNQYCQHLTYLKLWKTPHTEKEVIALTNEELFRLYGHKMFETANVKNEKDKKRTVSPETLSLVRDVFCFSCLTGLRYSDVMNLTKASVINNTHLKYNSIKTETENLITLNQYALAIIKKYNTKKMFIEFDTVEEERYGYQYMKNKAVKNKDSLFPYISNVNANLYLKIVCEQAGIDSPTPKVSFAGNKRKETTQPKYELISFHRGRRTHITLSLERGMRAEVVMKNSGHKDYKSFKKYIAVSDKTREQETQKAWNTSLLRAV